MRLRAIAILTFVVVASVAGPVRAGDVDATTGYRIGNYRSPVTLPPVGGTRIDLASLDRLRKDGAALVDVMPARAGFDAATGNWRLVETRNDIPGSTWLPNVGQGVLEPRLAAYFATEMRRLADGHVDKPIVIYCTADCWMSWNAVKRAASLGYTHISWFADGTDGWSEAGRPLDKAAPVPVPPLNDKTAKGADTH